MVDAINESRAGAHPHHRGPDRGRSTTTRWPASPSARSAPTPRDWAVALRAAMRQDPDVILIGEMRDAETVRRRALVRRRDRPLRDVDPAHHRRQGDGQPDHRLLPAARAEAGAARPGRLAARHRLPAPGARAPTAQGRAVAMEIAVNTPASGRGHRRPGPHRHDPGHHRRRRLLRHADLRPAPGAAGPRRHGARSRTRKLVSSQHPRLLGDAQARRRSTRALVDAGVRTADEPQHADAVRRASLAPTVPAAELADLDLGRAAGLPAPARGRGGQGRPTGAAWCTPASTCSQAESEPEHTLTLAELVRVLGDTGTGQARRALRQRPAPPTRCPSCPSWPRCGRTDVDPHDPRAGRRRARRGSTEAEQQLTTYRRALHERIDEATGELILRYRENPLRRAGR